MIPIKNSPWFLLLSILVWGQIHCSELTRPKKTYCKSVWLKSGSSDYQFCFELDSIYKPSEPDRPTWNNAMEIWSFEADSTFILISFLGPLDSFPSKETFVAIGNIDLRKAHESLNDQIIEGPKFREFRSAHCVWVSTESENRREIVASCVTVPMNLFLSIRITSYRHVHTESVLKDLVGTFK